MKTAGTCVFACIIGPEEREKESAAVKNMKDGSQIHVALNDIVNYLLERL